MSDAVFYTSDLHLFHRLVARNRGFSDDPDGLDAHNAEIAADWDARVHRDATVWVLGDLLANDRYLDAALEWIDARPGTKHLVSGNHDGCHPMHRGWVTKLKRYAEVFDIVTPMAAVRLEGQKVALSHFPYPELEGADHTVEPRFVEWRPRESGMPLLHGHTHDATQRYHDRQLHVGWDAWRRLVAQGDVVRILKERL